MPNQKENLIDKVLESTKKELQELGEKYPCSVLTTGCHENDELNEILKQTLQQELQKIAEDVIGEKGEKAPNALDEDSGLFFWGYNQKRQELITYFQSIGVEIK